MDGRVMVSLCKNPQQITDVVRLVFRSRQVGQPSSSLRTQTTSSARYNPYGKPSAATTSLSSSQPGSPLTGPTGYTGSGIRQMARLRDEEEKADAHRRAQATAAAAAAMFASQQAAAAAAAAASRRVTSASDDVVVSVEFNGQVTIPCKSMESHLLSPNLTCCDQLMKIGSSIGYSKWFISK
jgi:cytoskeletal protein RodZ